MRALAAIAIAAALCSVASGRVIPAQAAQPAPPAPQPRKPVEAILEAFKIHDLVALSDAHGNAQAEAFLRTLAGAPGFADLVDDIVVEFGNARYQASVDRYLRGERVTLEAIRPAWQNTTVPNQIWADEALFALVRGLNRARPRHRQIRILLGDPPIDWSMVRTREDHFRWLAMRDSFPAALVQVEVLARRRKALIVYGHLHFQRQQIASNFDMSDWRMQTIVSLIERATPIRVFTIWRLEDRLVEALPEAAAWPVPSLARTHGTRLGALDVAVLSPARTRMAVKDGAFVPVPRDQWRTLRVEEQLDAVLHLGSGPALTEVIPPARACEGPGFLEERLRRIALTGIPAFEAERVKRLCSTVH